MAWTRPAATYMRPGATRTDVRASSARLPTTTRPVAGGGFDLDLDGLVEGVAPGQAAVLYDGDAVVGAGTIE